MREVLVDTDILSFYFKGYPGVVNRFNEYLTVFDQVNISIITYYEILGGLSYRKAEKQILEFREFIANNNIIPVSQQSAEKSANIYAQLRQKGITIGTSDVLIAGVAIEHDLILISNNAKHFEPIEGLKIENWNR